MKAIREIIQAAAAGVSDEDETLYVDFGLISDINKDTERDFPLLFVLPITRNGAFVNMNQTCSYSVRAMLLYNHEADYGGDTNNTHRLELIDKAEELATRLIQEIYVTIDDILPQANFSNFTIQEVHNSNQATNYLCSGALLTMTINLQDIAVC
jgi:hypothetical protein